MKSRIIILILLVVLGALGISFTKQLIARRQSSQECTATSCPVVTKAMVEPDAGVQTDSRNGVVVEVSPIDIAATSTEWSFNVSMNTHTVSMDTDMAKSSNLKGDDDTEYAAVAWNGDPAGGHHRFGVLKFKAIKPVPKSITLTIYGLAGVDRSFAFEPN